MYLRTPSGNDFEIAPSGTHLAVCYRVIDLGTQKSAYQGKETERHKILISRELADERTSDGRPFIIGERYAWSMSEKSTLRKHLESWRGAAFTDKDFSGPPDGFSIQKVLGKGCLLTIAHNEEGGGTYANITAVSKLMKGMTVQPPENALIFLWLEQPYWDPQVFNVRGDGMKSIIAKSPEYVQLTTPAGRPTHDVAGRPIVPSPSIQPESENPAPPALQHPKRQVARPMATARAADMNDEIPF